MSRMFTRRTPVADRRRFALSMHAVKAGMTLWDGRIVKDVQVVPVTEDRSAGRQCDLCGQVGSHHTDRHGEFVTVVLTIEQVDMESASRELHPPTLTATGNRLVGVTDFSTTQVLAADSPFAVPLDPPKPRVGFLRSIFAGKAA